MKENKYRCHFSIIIEKVFSTIWILIVILLNEFISIIKDLRMNYIIKQELMISIVIMGVLLILTMYHFLIWRKTYIYIEDKSIVIEKNMKFFKKVNTISLATISTVNLEQNLFERIINTSKIKLDTNSMSTSDKTDVKIILKKDKAEEFKSLILAIINNEDLEEIKKEAVEDYYNIKYSFKDIVKHALYNISFISILIGIGMVLIVLAELGILDGNIKNQSIVDIIISVTILVIIPLISSIFNLFKFYDFKVGRRDDKIYISYGLITKKKYVIPISTISAIIVDEPLISRFFKRKNVELVNIGIGDDGKESSQLLLSENYEEYIIKLKSLLPEFKIKEDIKKQNKNCIYVNIFNCLIWAIGLGVFSSLTTWYFMIIMIIPIIYYVMKYNTWGIDIDEKYLGVATGTFRKRTKYIEYSKIQYVKISQGLISKIFKIYHGNIFILASLVNRVDSIGYYKLDEFEEINEKL